MNSGIEKRIVTLNDLTELSDMLAEIPFKYAVGPINKIGAIWNAAEKADAVKQNLIDYEDKCKYLQDQLNTAQEQLKTLKENRAVAFADSLPGDMS